MLATADIALLLVMGVIKYMFAANILCAKLEVT